MHYVLGCRDEVARAGAEPDELLEFVDSNGAYRGCESQVPDPGAIALQRARDGISAVRAYPDAVGFALDRVGDMQTALEIFDRALRIQLEVPADQVPCNTQRLVADGEAPRAIQCLPDQVAHLRSRDANLFTARSALATGLDFHRAAGWCDELDAEVVQARVTDVQRQPDSVHCSFAIDDDAPYQR